LVIFFLSLFNLAFCQNPISFTPGMRGKYIGRSVYLFKDPGRSLRFDDVRKMPGSFLPVKQDVVNLGISSDNNWLKFKIINASAENKIVLNLAYPTLDEVTLYSIDKNGKIDSNTILETTPAASRVYNHQNYIFDIHLAPGDSAECYLKIYSVEQALAPLSLNTPKSILDNISSIDILLGIFFGIMLVILLYNMFVYFSVRDKSYLIYVHYIFWVTVTQLALQGYGHRFLWGNSDWLTVNMVNIAGAMSGMATIFFVQYFLQTKKYVPKLNIGLNVIVAGDIISILLVFLGKPGISYLVIDVTAGLGSFYVLFVAYRLYRMKHRSAGFFLLAWTIFLVTVILFVLKDAGVFPYNTFTSFILLIGSSLEAILLSFALADKINIFRKEKEESQAQALVALQENERIVREQNVILEGKVNERTYELKVSNDGLNKTMNELKEAQSQLVESEKMASLGQLTAGIAHEINNPINFVTSNVKPLNRDVHILLETIDTLEKIAFEEKPAVEKQKQIQAHKNDIDFDYLKVEINQLLDGIGEGASRTAEIVKGLRIFSRLDEDDLKKADINECLDSTLVIANNLIGGTIKVEKKYANLPVVECYPGKLNQVFLNIISNAVYAIKKKFTDTDGGILTVATSFDADHVFISIADNGIGMDENTKRRLFEPFFTTKDVGEGTGLGMSIAYNTINKHNGQIIINSALGIGTEFIIKLPLTRE
jgi:two-component system, NtrC family, sensor kinase